MGRLGRWLLPLITIPAAAALLPLTALATDSPAPGRWLTQPHDVILGCGCTPFQLEPVDPRFHCPDGLRVHEGIDFDTPIGTPVYDGMPGVVAAIGAPETHDYGPHYLRIWLDEGHDLILGHLSSELVGPGQRLKVGQLLGYTGDLGETNVPNLHFEVRIHGGTTYQSVDPAAFLTLEAPAAGPDAAQAAAASPLPAAAVQGTLPDPRPYIALFVALVGIVLLVAGTVSAPRRRPRH